MARKRSVADEIGQTRPFASKAQEATVALLRTADVVRRRFTRIVEPAGLTFQQYNVLRILRGSAPAPLSALEISERLIEETPGVSRLIDRLLAKGLIRRDRSGTDRRMLECSITPKGLELLAKLDRPVLDADEQLGKQLSAKGIERLTGLLAEIRDRDS